MKNFVFVALTPKSNHETEEKSRANVRGRGKYDKETIFRIKPVFFQCGSIVIPFMSTELPTNDIINFSTQRNR